MCTDFVIALSSTFEFKSVTILSCKSVHIAVASTFLLASHDVQNACRAVFSGERLAENWFGTYIMHDLVAMQSHLNRAPLKFKNESGYLHQTVNTTSFISFAHADQRLFSIS